MSDSDDLSTPGNLPSNAVIENCLKQVVRNALKKGDEITVRIARSLAENELGLDADFLKDNVEWKTKSKDIITATATEPNASPSPEPVEPKSRAKAGRKRGSEDTQPARKRQKKVDVTDSEDLEDEFQGKDVKPSKKPVKKATRPRKQRQKKTIDSDSEDMGIASDSEVEAKVLSPMPMDSKSKQAARSSNSSELSEPPETEISKAHSEAAVDDSSDYSIVHDDPPPKKKRQSKSSSPGSKNKAKAPAKAQKSTAASKEVSPDEEEIKRLQSHLLKCGIRKLWHRELAHCSSDKDKIRHLRKMLEDAGMTGRFSAEKARAIKEARELAAEIESAKEFEKQFGHKSGESDDDDGSDDRQSGRDDAQPKKRLPKGLVDFGDSGDDGSD
ncbi:Hypothetical protein R9X50_00689000 [Acrodontium crateriforme]|uniref:Transcriptional regulator n=1 Tax=Acrodontium crateriforme TaxID=150365 RepID=A0AAQ3RBU8_9PEZI|nr:Hypothetical protein R9X50_00689000 [Acrodontium crateriforme]